MVSLKHIKSKCPLAMQRGNQPGFHGEDFRGNLSSIKVPVYRIGRPPSEGNFNTGFQDDSYQEQSLLDSLLLARWEESSWNGLVKYDVTSCPIKVVGSGWKFIVQLNENCCLNLGEFESIPSQQLGPSKCSGILKEDILFCVTTKDVDSSESVLSAAIPKDSIVIILNGTPVEYGHVLLLPYNFHNDLSVSESLESIIQIAAEINNSSLRIFYDSPAHAYFQACYFVNPLAVEIMPVLSIYNDSTEKGLSIFEVANYPLKALMFYSNTNIGMLIDVVSDVCSTLHDQHIQFNLLISECGTKIFLFLQVQTLMNDRSLCAWECCGHLLVNTFEDFEKVNEEDIISYLAAISIDDKGFEAVKQVCCDAAHKLAQV